MDRMRRAVLIAGLSLGFGFTIAMGDVVHLKDGTQLVGSIKRGDHGWDVHTADKIVHVTPDEVESIDLTPATNPSPKVAAERLASLERSVDAVSDLNDIIARFQRFVDQVNDPAANAEAKKDLAMWQDRLRQKMVKVGAKWVTPAERDQLLAQAGATAETARQLMKQGRSKEAEPLLVDVTTVDPQNATALYLIALLRYQQEQMPPARKALEGVAAIIPNHAPTLNNLAVVMWRQHQYIPALQNFDAAMLADPIDKTILDNVAVAFQTLPFDLQRSPVTQKALRHFNEQDQKLAERMSHDGMHRFGSLWVSDKDIADMQAKEKAIQEKLDALSSDFDRSRAHADQLNGNISDATSDMHQIEAASIRTDPITGASYTVPYPSTYDDLQRDIQRDTRDRDVELARMDAIKKQAQDLQNSKPSAHSQGVMEVFGPEGTPIKIAAVAPPSQPAVK